MKTLLHIDNSPAITGGYKALLSWCLQNPQWQHIWILPKGSFVSAETSRYFKVYELPMVEIGKSPTKLVSYLPMLWYNGRKLQAILKKEQPNLIHTNDLNNLLPYAVKRQVPFIVHARRLQRSFPVPLYNFWKQWHLKRADGIVAVSQAVKKDWNNDERVTVIYDPITIHEQYPPYHFYKQEEQPFRFLYLSNYIQGKGQDDALKAIAMLQDKGVTNFKVDFYGGTMGLEKNVTYKKNLEAFVNENKLDDIVTFHGLVQDVEQVMKQYHALLHFSHAESFGMVCYEALYYRLPVISSDCGGPAEMIDNGRSGILLPLKDIAAYADAMESFIVNPEIPHNLSLAAHDYLTNIHSQTYDLSVFFSKYLSNK